MFIFRRMRNPVNQEASLAFFGIAAMPAIFGWLGRMIIIHVRNCISAKAKESLILSIRAIIAKAFKTAGEAWQSSMLASNDFGLPHRYAPRNDDLICVSLTIFELMDSRVQGRFSTSLTQRNPT